MPPSLIWSTLEKLGTIMGVVSLGLLGADNLLAYNHHLKGYLLFWGFVCLGAALLLGVVGVVGQFRANQKLRQTTPPLADSTAQTPLREVRPQSALGVGKAISPPVGTYVVKTDGGEVLMESPSYRYGASIWAQPWWTPARRSAFTNIFGEQSYDDIDKEYGHHESEDG